MAALLEYFPLLVCLLVAAVVDVRQRRIPNWLTLGLMAAGLAREAAIGGTAGIGQGLAGMAAGASAPLILYLLGALGGGDVKLLAGVGAWLGPRQALAVLAIQAIIGLFVVLIQAWSQGRMAALFRNSAVLAAGMTQNGLASGAPGGGRSFSSIDRPLPYAVPVGLATLVVLLAGPLMG